MKTYDTFKKELSERTQLVNDTLEKLLPPAERYPSVIHEASRYSVFAGGKRIRPVLAISAAEIMGGDVQYILPAACALELIHTYSLIHDDLPAMDDDDMRRGMPTCHKKYGEAIAILAGDALLTKAFEVIALCPVKGTVTHQRLLNAIGEISQAAGTDGMIGGQVADITSVSINIDKNTMSYIHRKKTGAIFRSSCRVGAILSGAGEDDLKKLTEYGDHLGMAFQITDDILDIIGDEKLIGKPVKSDIKNNKATYPALFGLDTAREMAARERDMALAAISGYGEKADFLRDMVRYIVDRNH